MTIVSKDGQAKAGFVRDESSTQVTLVDILGKAHRIAKAQIQKRVDTSQSLMPATFGESLTEQQFRDLMAWLLALRH